MYDINSQDEYDTLVEELADEFEFLQQPVVGGSVKRLAKAVVASKETARGDSDESGYVVDDTAEFNGRSVGATDGEAVSPYDIFPYVDETILGEYRGADPTALAAAELLADDIRAVWEEK